MPAPRCCWPSRTSPRRWRSPTAPMSSRSAAWSSRARRPRCATARRSSARSWAARPLLRGRAVLGLDAGPQGADHVLHLLGLLPAVGQLVAVRPGDRVLLRAELAQEGEGGVLRRALAPAPEAVL